MNDEDTSLRHLARLARERARAPEDDVRWEALVRGEASEAEEAALRRLSTSDARGALLYAAFRPLDGLVRQRIVTRLEQMTRLPSRAHGYRHRARQLAVWSAAAIAAAGALIALAPRSPRPSEYAARGRIVSADPPRKSSRVFVYDVHRSGDVVPVSTLIRRSDELAFAYENAARLPWLAVFAVDEHRRVYWFYPEWASEADDPLAIPADSGPGRKMLPDAVRHDFEGSRLEIRALFLGERLSVRQIEALLREHDGGSLALGDVLEDRQLLEVIP